jgi:hypothetical protein
VAINKFFKVKLILEVGEMRVKWENEIEKAV